VDRSPPPFFNQGAPAHIKLLMFALLAIALLVADSRYSLLYAMRQGLAAVLLPIQRTLLVPRDAWQLGSVYFQEVNALRAENEALKRLEITNAQALLRAEQMASDNTRLRDLLGAREKLATRSMATEVLYENRDAFSRSVTIDKGSRDGVLEGMPVIDANGLVGQVTRSFVASAEVTLITDKNMAIPVESQRSGQRSVLFGAGAGELELRYLANSVELKAGEVWMTSGLDGIYPAGLPVGKVKAAPSEREGSFARNRLQPLAAVEQARLLLVLLIDKSALPAPSQANEGKPGKRTGNKSSP
jgi:rod shape-determining protein MreC